MVEKVQFDKRPYLELLKLHLIDLHRVGVVDYSPLKENDFNLFQKIFLRFCKAVFPGDLALCKKQLINQGNRVEGKDWPTHAYSMVGLKRLNNVEYCIRKVIADGVEGDLIETGVWKGGTVIFMRAILEELRITDRTVWVADSFRGLPKPDPKRYPADKNDRLFSMKELAIDLETVKSNFRFFNLLDDKVQFIQGWFKDSLPNAPIEKLALLRLDGDMYESTMDALTNLYPKLSSGGFCIVDDFGAIPACKQAVDDYRERNGIKETMVEIDWTGVFWRKA